MKSSLGEMRVAVVSRVNVQVQFGGKGTEILYQDGVESIRHQNSNRSGLRSTFPIRKAESEKSRIEPLMTQNFPVEHKICPFINL